jgi:hypothetical protein
MSPELEAALVLRYPDVLGRVAGPTRGQLWWSGEHRNGWYPLVDAICEVLTARGQEIGEWPKPLIQLGDELEGTRFCAHLSTDEYVYEAVSMAALHSRNLCEITGGPGRPTRAGNGWRGMMDWHGIMSPRISLGRYGFEDNDTPPPPLGADETTRFLTMKWPSIVRCAPAIPGGWLDLVSTLVGWISERRRIDPDDGVVIEELREHDGDLFVGLRQRVVGDDGSIAFATAMARRTDPMTGQTAVLLSPGGRGECR